MEKKEENGGTTIGEAVVMFCSRRQQWEKKEVLPGETIIRQGETINCVYQMVKGKAVVFVLDERGEALIQTGKIKEGEVFGEMSFFMGTPCTATVITEVPCRLSILKREVLQKRMDTNPRGAVILLQRILKVVCERLSRTNEELAAERKALNLCRDFFNLSPEEFEKWQRRKQEGK